MPAEPYNARRLLTWIAGLCSVALFLPLTWPLVKGRVFVFDDLANFHLPVRYLYRNALRGGDSILWTPSLFAGYYLHGEGQTGMLHPLHLLLYGTLPLGAAFNLEMLSSYAIGFGGMFYFLRRLRLSPAAAVTGAMLFAFGGFQLLHLHHLNLVAVTAHVPWLLASLDMLIAADTPRRRAGGYCAVALVLASEVLLGFPQGVWWNLLAGAGFAVARGVQLGRSRRLVPCAAAMLTGLLLGAIQLLPTLDVAAHSTRAVEVPGFALTFSLHPLNALQLWSPYVFAGRVYSSTDTPLIHEFGIYAGALALVAPCWLWVRRRALGPHRILAAGATVFAAVMFLLALGRYGGLDVLLTHIPGLASLRAPARYIVLVQFALAMLAAIAVEDLVRLPPGRVRLTPGAAAVLCIPLILSVATTLILNTHLIRLAGVTPAPLARAAAGTALLAAITAAVLGASRTKVALLILVPLAALDLGWWGMSYVWMTRPRSIASLTAMVPPPAESGRYLWADEWRDRPVLRGHELAWGYAGLFPATTLSVDDVTFQRLAGVRGTVAADLTITPLNEPAPRARLSGGSPGSAVVVTDRPGHIVIRTSAPDRQLLSLTERFHQGWAVTTGGTRLEAIALHGDFLACVVPAGTHRVEFRFMPKSFVLGAAVSAAGAALLALGAAIVRRSTA